MTGIPAGRYVERLAAARREAGAAGLDALLVGVGAGPPVPGRLRRPCRWSASRCSWCRPPRARRSRWSPHAWRRRPPAPARRPTAGALEIATWEETEDPMALVASPARGGNRDGGRRDRRRGRVRRAPRGVRPRSPAGAARRAVLRDVERPAGAPHAQGRRRGGPAAGGRPGRRPGRGRGRRAARSSDGPRRTWPARSGSASSPRATNAAEFWIVASGPNSASPHHEPGERVIAGGEPIVIDIGGTLGGYGSDITRTVWVTGPEGRGPGRGVPAPVRRPPATPRRRRPPRSGPACPARRSTVSHGGASRTPGTGPQFFHRTGTRDRPRGPRGAVPRRGQPRAARAGHGVQRGARDLPRGPVRGPDRGHRRVRRDAGRRPQRGDPRPPGRHRLNRARPGRGAARPPEVSSADRPRPPADARASNHDHPSRAGDRPAPPRPMSRHGRHGRHQHSGAAAPASARGAGARPPDGARRGAHGRAPGGAHRGAHVRAPGSRRRPGPLPHRSTRSSTCPPPTW